jgi:hypothetical protein
VITKPLLSTKQRVRIANTYVVYPAAGVQFLGGPEVTGKNPPNVTLIGSPINGTTSPFVGQITVAITGAGPRGTATAEIFYNGTGVASFTTAASIPLSGTGLVMLMDNGVYDTSNTYTWYTGVNPADGWGGDVVVAAGPAPQDFTGSAVNLGDSAHLRVHGPATVMLPVDPWDGMRVEVMDADGSAATSGGVAVTVSGGVAIQNPYNLGLAPTNGTMVLVFAWQCVEWTYDLQVGLWRVTHDSHASELPAQAVSTSTTGLIGRSWAKCNTASGAITIETPVITYDGLRFRVSDIAGAASTHNITITAMGTTGVESPGGTVSAPGGNATMSTNRQACTWEFDSTGVPFGGSATGVWRLVGVN